MDVGISKVKPVYSYNISRYNKILFQRNNLLKSNKFKKDLINLLDVFDMQIATIGTSIILERQQYVEQLSKIANKTHKDISSNIEELELKYTTNVSILENKSQMEKSYLNLLKQNFKKDAESGTTEIGPHKDDIYMTINNKEVRTYGSQGQQRTVVLSLKFSEVELIKVERGMYPVLLLDDVFSELDEERRNYLISLFKDVQTFITVTDAIDLKSMTGLDKSIFYIENGNFK
jgi:DNA replication and repair protein RecF